MYQQKSLGYDALGGTITVSPSSNTRDPRNVYALLVPHIRVCDVTSKLF